MGFQASLELSRDSGEHCQAGGLHGRVLSHGMAALREPLYPAAVTHQDATFLPLPAESFSSGPALWRGFFYGGRRWWCRFSYLRRRPIQR
jgi:hypothetical protein